MPPVQDQALHLQLEKAPRRVPVLAFETGANHWRRYDAWPPADLVETRRLYLQPGGGLDFEPPADAGDTCTEYVSDPAKPVPCRVRPIPPFSGAGSTWDRWLVDDQRPFADRTDVLVSVSWVLDDPLTLSGEVAATLFASTTGTDADWVVKLIDLYPDEVPGQPELGGFQLMISDDILRGCYRESYPTARPIPPGEVLPKRIAMPHVHHAFLPGHRVLVQVLSSWFPVCDRNPQTFVEEIAWTQPEDFRKATHRIYHGGDTASYVELPVQVAPRTAATRRRRALRRRSAPGAASAGTD